MTPKKWVLTITIVLLNCSALPSLAQNNKNIKRNVATVLFASLGGAILGLSTLPFYGEPQEHTDNISYGALGGFVVGMGYVFYNSARPTASTYDYSKIFDQDLKSRRGIAALNPVQQFQFTIDF